MEDFMSTMMPFFKEILQLLLMGIAAWVGIKVKSFINEKDIAQMDENKKSIVRNAVRFAEETFKLLDGPSKFEKAKEEAARQLTNRGIPYSSDELTFLIQSVVSQFNGNFVNDTKSTNVIEVHSKRKRKEQTTDEK